MSRLSRSPVGIPKGVDVSIDGQLVTVKGVKGSLQHRAHTAVMVEKVEDSIRCRPVGEAAGAEALAGTTRALVGNMVTGVTVGFEKRLQLVGVGYRAQMKDAALNLSLGYSHPIDFPVPDGIKIETPSQTEVVVSGIDKQRVGQAAAVIRGFRPPEPYKGKGVRYADENVVRKEAKKK